MNDFHIITLKIQGSRQFLVPPEKSRNLKHRPSKCPEMMEGKFLGANAGKNYKKKGSLFGVLFCLSKIDFYISMFAFSESVDTWPAAALVRWDWVSSRDNWLRVTALSLISILVSISCQITASVTVNLRLHCPYCWSCSCCNHCTQQVSPLKQFRAYAFKNFFWGNNHN